MSLPSRTDPKLLDLTERYAKLNVCPRSLWATWADNINIERFRGEHAYLAQEWGGMTEERYQNSYQYVVQHAPEELWNLGEDDAFGCVTFVEKCDDPEAKPDIISRDLIDSALEIAFLRRSLSLDWYDEINVLDIGAGYGRFAHRLATAMDNAYVFCTDGVPLSTYLCDYYLKYRAVQYAESIPLDALDVIRGEPGGIQIACNMQSFSEMPLASINFWLDLCVDLKIPYFFLEPHAGDLVHPHYFSTEPDCTTHLNYRQAFTSHGYKMVKQEYKFPEAESEKYIYNSQFSLWERK